MPPKTAAARRRPPPPAAVRPPENPDVFPTSSGPSAELSHVHHLLIVRFVAEDTEDMPAHSNVLAIRRLPDGSVRLQASGPVRVEMTRQQWLDFLHMAQEVDRVPPQR